MPTKTENQKQKPKIPSFPRKWESSSFGFACFKFRVTSTSSFPRRRESRHSMLRQFIGND
ncbi:hypothetical protein COI17_11695 [Neisseria meningitidis]|nr:hypothetical protein COI17_11695 [Neisseria meningitidis]